MEERVIGVAENSLVDNNHELSRMMTCVNQELKDLGGQVYYPELIATDIDGTLINSSSRIAQRTLDVLRRIYRSGTPLVLATGRPPRWIRPITEQLGFNPLCVCSNGAMIYDSDVDQVVEVTELTTHELEQITAMVRSLLPGVSFGVERSGGVGSAAFDDRLYITEDYDRVWHDPHDNVISNEEIAAEPCIKMLVRHHEKSSAALAEIISGPLKNLATVTYSIDGGLAEVSAFNVSKVHGVESCARGLGLSAKDIVAFGDMPNDIELIKWAGIGVAMGNALSCVQEAANIVTTSNDNNGLAHVLEQWWPAGEASLESVSEFS